jgi:hypothetical protein
MRYIMLSLMSISFCEGVFGTLADVMHLLEEGIVKYLLSVFLEPLSDTILGTLTIMFPNCLVPKPIVVLAGERSPCQFHPGSRLTLLGSEERMF